jgi:bifunctional non-homologous end joining protein LigD
MADVPRSIAPMRATGGYPVPTGDEWGFEIKWDGIRAIVYVERGTLRLDSSNGADITRRWPELAPLATELADHDAVLDGEIVTFNPDGRPDFGLLQQRMHISSAAEAARWAARQPAVLVLFDLLWLDGHDATPLAYEQRRRLLEDLVEPGPNWQVPAYQRTDGAELLDAVHERGMEGLMAKRLDSPYEPGRRTSAWRKLKKRRRQEFVVGGWLPGEGNRRPTMGALLVGYQEGGRLHYAGRVGSGFNQAALDRWMTDLDRLAIERSPFDPPPPAPVARLAHYVEPVRVIEVAFQEWTHDDHLRAPSYLGDRFDKDPVDVVREPM